MPVSHCQAALSKAWEGGCHTGEVLVLGDSWESFLGSLTSKRNCLDRSRISVLWSITRGFADKLLISIMVSTWHGPQNSRWKVSKLFIQQISRF